jgi:hypothetical protein
MSAMQSTCLGNKIFYDHSCKLGRNILAKDLHPLDLGGLGL